MATSELPQPSIVLSDTSIPQPGVLHSASLPPLAFSEKCPKKRDAAIDLRIGLHLLGQEGRKLLAEYINTNQEQ